MTEFLTPIDVGNRALQHVGQEMMDPVLGFIDGTKRAEQVGFAYAKLRRAELERNVWRFATRRTVLRPIDADTLLLVPAMWSSVVTYFYGSIVSDEHGNIWISILRLNTGNQPEESLTWQPYYGPMSISLYATGTSYASMELVYVPVGDGTSRIYISLENGNEDNPATATAWSATVTYKEGQVVTYLSVPYMSQVGINKGNIPVSSPTQWTPTFTGGTGSLKWLQIGGAEFSAGVSAAPLDIIYPIGAGPLSQNSTRNSYRLPCGYLRMAPQAPKAGSTSYLGASTSLAYNDWELEDDYIVTAETGALTLRFVCDMNDVRRMTDMFCEGLAARIAFEVCEPLTQSTAKLGALKKIYDDLMGEARLANAIEIGSEEPPEDDFIACRR